MRDYLRRLLLAVYLVPLLPDDFRPVERLGELPEAPLIPVRPLNCAALLAVTGKLLRPLVLAADFRLLTFSFAILNSGTSFLTEAPCSVGILYAYSIS